MNCLVLENKEPFNFVGVIFKSNHELARTLAYARIVSR